MNVGDSHASNMSDERTITVAEVSDGPGGHGEPGTDVSLPVVELLTGR